MSSHRIVYKLLLVLLASFGLLAATLSHAFRGAVERSGEAYRQNDNIRQNNNDYRDNYYGHYYDANPGVVISVPYGGYPVYPNSCSTVQQCDSDGNCTQSQVCN